MGNSLGGKRVAKVMKINGETIKLKTPIYAGEVVKDYPGFVLLESEAVKHFGIRAKPLEPQQELKPKGLYFLVELPKFPEENTKGPRRVRSGIQMSAKDRLESLMLARRSVSDLSHLKPASIVLDEQSQESSPNGAMRLKMRLPKAQVEKMMMESKDEAEAAAKIMEFCMANTATAAGGAASSKVHHWKNEHGIVKQGLKPREKRVGFLPFTEGEIQLAVS
ncbi:uncharacterized protein At1g66480-like [Coffea eugenioides]|uniref:Uncharacterized protein At1g66480-like n=1 Tax=Coffea arabica TaxID=13443 RepID=A0A6P6V9W2_COFAR|nr:uncharacterized protein At1g66480-like [Coffea arabica]XP_027154121.1 uncharacterized protein At1g66480-like [Coffea eugenioides]